eukprot:CAMPEP_0176393592 /NCGR_PEP_ID=MMETSP0126-20121128/41868_1 /TAXON_ID=141414 ORGANISM="Strombidinopsis acuminatum, Strain SPMC142" /NCGR_SAMPLE_ID=MMETSP0126 /ASSEMBLY_ACC=CAM_ASM_000229 /LENGTH=56 /DNA_ID=CAMNT_0017765235 /DNA_START=355 /DNA_END=525 /DNA_ORIENTATION=-
MTETPTLKQSMSNNSAESTTVRDEGNGCLEKNKTAYDGLTELGESTPISRSSFVPL